MSAEPRRPCLEDTLVVFNRLAAVTRSHDDGMGTARKETFDNFNSNRTFSNTGDKSILVFESHAGCCDLVENVEIDTNEVARVFILKSRRFALEMK